MWRHDLLTFCPPLIMWRIFKMRSTGDVPAGHNAGLLTHTTFIFIVLCQTSLLLACLNLTASDPCGRGTLCHITLSCIFN